MTKRTKKSASSTISKPAFPLNKTLLAICISAAMQPAVAQETTQDKESLDAGLLEEVTVYGVRSSLKTAQDIKKNADTHVDAISASDINALPDVSVLEALQRVPGVSIERFASSNDPDHFSTEGSGVTLRGLPNSRSEVNGRDTFSANSGRGLSFQDVSPELLGSVKIFKNQTADMVEGGISGTVDLNTRKPFDSEDPVFSISAQANYGDLEKETTPSFSALYSNRWEISNGEIGVLASYANADLDFRSDGAQFGIHNMDSAGRFAPVNGGIRSTSTERKREGVSLALQYENTDKAFSALLEYIRSDSENNWNEHAFFDDTAGGTPSANSIYSGAGIFQSGTIMGTATAFGPQTRFQQGNTLVEDLSFKLGFSPTDKLNITADVQYVDSKTDVLDLSVFGGLQNGADIDLVLDGDTPVVNFRAPASSNESDAAYFSNPNNYFFRAAMDHVEESVGDELAARLDFDYDLDFDFARSVEAGVRFAERDQTTRWSNYNWGGLSESWTGFASFAGQASNNGFSSTQASAFSFGDFHAGNINGLPDGVGLFADTSLVSDYSTFRSTFDVSTVGRTPSFGRPTGNANSPYIPAEINSTNEQNTSAYVRLNFGVDGDRRLEGNVGLRYVKLDTTVKGGQTFVPFTGNAATTTGLPSDYAQFLNGASSAEDAESSFDTVLPSLNIKYEISPEVIARFGASKALAFPGLGNLRYNYNISAQTTNGAFTRYLQSSGNPFLKPMEATNLDASIEYYFDDTDYVSVGVFHKDIKNFFSNNTIPTPVTNNGITSIVDIDQPINIDTATLSGLEFSYQQFFDELPGAWSGLGMQFNFTYLDPSNVPQQNLRPVQSGNASDQARASIPFTDLPLQGLSETQYNLVGLFQNEKWEARLAYNWRDDYLLTIREVNIGLPTYADARGQLDGSIFYSLNDQWQLGLQGSNLLQDEVITRNQVDQAGTQVFRTSFVFDRRLTFVVRGNF